MSLLKSVMLMVEKWMELVPTKMVIASLNSSYWYWDAAVAPFGADDRDRDDRFPSTPIGSTVDQDGCVVATSSDERWIRGFN